MYTVHDVADRLGISCDDARSIAEAGVCFPARLDGACWVIDAEGFEEWFKRTGGLRIVRGPKISRRKTESEFHARPTPHRERPVRSAGLEVEDEALTAKQVAALLNCSLDAVYELRYSGLLRSTKMPRVGVRFQRADIEEFWLAHTRRPDAKVTNSPELPRGPRAGRSRDGDEEVIPGLSRAELKKIAGF